MVTSSLHACQSAESSCLRFTNNYATTAALPPFDLSFPFHVTTDSYATQPFLFDVDLTGTTTDAHTTSTSTTTTTTAATTATHWIASVPRGGGGSSGSSSGDDTKNGGKDDGSRSSASNSIVEEILASPEDYYRALGLEDRQHCTSTDIQKAYRRRAVQTHPDKTGGDRRAFDIVAKAYDVLSNDDTRAIYDKFGTEGLNHGHTTHSFQDFFQSMFHPSSSSSFVSRNRTMRYQLQVSLEDLYRGTTHDVWVTAPGKRHGKTVQVDIPRGTVGGQPIIMSGAMDFASSKGVPPGDLIFVISPTPHAIFTRKNHDLAMELTLSLEEALCGFQKRTITHLDGTTLEIASAVVLQDGEETPVMIASGDVQVLKGKGFPKNPHGDEYGDLYIQFRVDMPQHKKHASWTHPLNHEERQQLRQLLEKLQGKKSTDHQKTNNDKKSKRRKGKMTENKMSPNEASPTDPEDAPEEASVQSSSSASGTDTAVHRLCIGKASDFGRATGIAKMQRDDHEQGGHDHDDHDDDFLGQGGGGGFSFPFGSGTSTFFQHSSSGGPSRSFYFGNPHSHFFGQDGTTQGMEDDGIPPQCPQM